MFLFAFVVLFTAATAQSPTRCTNHANGYCLSMFSDICPSGTYVSYSGCGFLEQCCYIPDSNHVVTTQSPVAVTHSGTAPRCGVADYSSDHKIVGGSQTVIEKYPWQVSIHVNGYHSCGGSIISDRWILTAAHCIKEMPQPVYLDQFTIIAGSTNQKYYSRVTNYYTADQILTHPGYVKNTRNDIAMIKLNKALDFTGRQKKPICLADPTEDFTGQVCVATGWGVTVDDDNQDLETYLREVALPVVSRSLCSYYLGYVDTNNVCAGHRTGGKDTCQGDSGGPLICQNSQGIWKQIGIVSYGDRCALANRFGVYTEVSKFRSWIQDIMSRY